MTQSQKKKSSFSSEFVGEAMLCSMLVPIGKYKRALEFAPL
jgi:hypothetical protein